MNNVLYIPMHLNISYKFRAPAWAFIEELRTPTCSSIPTWCGSSGSYVAAGRGERWDHMALQSAVSPKSSYTASTRLLPSTTLSAAHIIYRPKGLLHGPISECLCGSEKSSFLGSPSPYVNCGCTADNNKSERPHEGSSVMSPSDIWAV